MFQLLAVSLKSSQHVPPMQPCTAHHRRHTARVAYECWGADSRFRCSRGCLVDTDTAHPRSIQEGSGVAGQACGRDTVLAIALPQGYVLYACVTTCSPYADLCQPHQPALSATYSLLKNVQKQSHVPCACEEGRRSAAAACAAPAGAARG